MNHLRKYQALKRNIHGKKEPQEGTSGATMTKIEKKTVNIMMVWR